MDKTVRNALRLTVTECRKLLESDFLDQLEGVYGIRVDRIEPLETLTHLSAFERVQRQAIEAAVRHHLPAATDPPDSVAAGLEPAVRRFARESAFTVLNRLAALKLMEAPSRKLIPQTVGAAQASGGFKQFQRVAPVLAHTMPDGGYRAHLELLFDDLASELGAVFDRGIPQSVLFPKAATLEAVLDCLNAPGLMEVWDQDETLGWIFQFFTPKELRDEARKASAAPRDALELAFRNQFFTPRYVVEFLVDNTLGRTWFEMRGGQTRLVERCRFLIRRPDEALDPRAKRDPREWRVLDPACGSGHFLLYAFDVLVEVYLEAFDDPDLGPALRAEYGDLEAFKREVPRLIIERNLHGVDIDLRAAQIAQLALWLRAQRAWAEWNVKPAERPRVRGSGVVAAEPMPLERGLLEEFLNDLRPAALAPLVRELWQRMGGVDELGVLARLETAMRDRLRQAKQEFERFKHAQAQDEGLLFEEARAPRAQGLFDFVDLTDAAFFDEAEARAVQALRDLTRGGDGEDAYTRTLFAQDAQRGLALFDLLQAPFDVVLMNPPFGAPSLGSKAYLEREYPRTKNDLYAVFVERGLELLRPRGMLGAITSRTGFFLTTFKTWREEILLRESRLVAVADLGGGVLDTAMVETAAYVLEKRA